MYKNGQGIIIQVRYKCNSIPLIVAFRGEKNICPTQNVILYFTSGEELATPKRRRPLVSNGANGELLFVFCLV